MEDAVVLATDVWNAHVTVVDFEEMKARQSREGTMVTRRFLSTKFTIVKIKYLF
jgi:hypothetical protein